MIINVTIVTVSLGWKMNWLVKNVWRQCSPMLCFRIKLIRRIVWKEKLLFCYCPVFLSDLYIYLCKHLSCYLGNEVDTFWSYFRWLVAYHHWKSLILLHQSWRKLHLILCKSSFIVEKICWNAAIELCQGRFSFKSEWSCFKMRFLYTFNPFNCSVVHLSLSESTNCVKKRKISAFTLSN